MNALSRHDKARAEVLIREIGVGLLQLERIMRSDADRRAYQELVDADSAWDRFEEKFAEWYPDTEDNE